MTREQILAVAKPILFNTPMTQAVREDRKNTTRRVVNGITPNYRFLEMIENPCVVAVNSKGEEYPKEIPGLYASFEGDDTAAVDFPLIKAPYRPRDLLYVRETWCRIGNPRAGRPMHYCYRADMEDPTRDDMGFIACWHPSIHMPKEAARIFLQVTDVRVERLREITDDGAKAEGARYTDFGMYQPSWKASLDGGKTFHPAEPAHRPGWHMKDATKPEQCFPSARGAFAHLWDSTIHKSGIPIFGWGANPWVWVIKFERLEADP